jgi:hypothetical protein
VRRLIKPFVLSTFLIAALSLSLAKAQTASAVAPVDPYRNFVGSWSGKILVNPDNMPAAVKLNIKEDKNRTRMRWDYVFGVKGEKGYSSATKFIVLKPEKALMTMQWKGHSQLDFGTLALDTFVQNGFGEFVGGAVWNDTPSSIAYNRITVDLHPATLSYLWEVGPDRQSFKIYSKFEFQRDGNLATSESKE